jgi:hypothetical protein
VFGEFLMPVNREPAAWGLNDESVGDLRKWADLCPVAIEVARQEVNCQCRQFIVWRPWPHEDAFASFMCLALLLAIPVTGVDNEIVMF